MSVFYPADVLPIAQQGEAILQQVAQPVGDVHDPALQQLIDRMHATLLAANGVGIAAPQVFVGLRIMIVASRPNPRYPDAPLMEPMVMINPELLWRSTQTCAGEEGCLSVPGQRITLKRAQTVRVRYLTRDATLQEAEYSGFVARIIQHEYDHLEGILLTEHPED